MHNDDHYEYRRNVILCQATHRQTTAGPHDTGDDGMATQTDPLTLSVDETAKLLKIGRRTCYRAVADGTLPSLRFGKAIRIPRSALEAALRDTFKPTDDQANAAK